MQYLLRLYRADPVPIDEIPIVASDEQEARDLARMHVLMARGVAWAAAEHDGRECFRIERGGADAAF